MMFYILDLHSSDWTNEYSHVNKDLPYKMLSNLHIDCNNDETHLTNSNKFMT